MSITSEEKKEYAVKFGGNEANTGDTKVQVAIMTHRIAELTEHLKINKKVANYHILQ